MSCPSAPSILSISSGQSERPQPDLSVHGRPHVFLVPGHALPATGDPGPSTPTEQGRRCHLHGIPTWRRQQLRAG